MDKHIPVLLKEVIEGLAIKNDGIYIDLTLGRAGHSSEILKRIPNGYLYGFDQDETAIKESEERLTAIGSNFSLFHLNFKDVRKKVEELNLFGKVNGILMDLGVSSPQFDNAERGFSYNYDGPLDMRMDRRNSISAKTIVNTYSKEDLTKIFREYGDEKYASSIAYNIVKVRSNKVIETTFDLVDIIKSSKPMKELKKAGHPAKQVFQALRIATNDELNVLKETLNELDGVLAKKGRLAIITFHSGEDRIVKQFFKEKTVVEGDRISGPTKLQTVDYIMVNHKPIEATQEELEINRRSHSAKLRILERKG